MILLAALMGAQSISTGGSADLKPSTTEAIATGGRTCLGATVDPAAFEAKLSGWTDMASAQKKGMKVDGRALVRDNVMIAYKPGVDGGCVVMAQPAPGFDKAALLTQLSAAAGTTIGADPQNPVTMLPNGELMVVQIGADSEAGVMLVVASQKNGRIHPSPTPPQPQGK